MLYEAITTLRLLQLPSLLLFEVSEESLKLHVSSCQQ